jgi:hypothetical protein
MPGPLALRIGDVVELRKTHPCGGSTWRILRVGLDIGIECMTCQRYILVPRRRLEGRIRRFLERGSEPDAPATEDRSEAQ